MMESEIPAAAPEDAVMASPAEVQEALDWAAATFARVRPAGRVPLQVRRQDHNVLNFGRSCMETPIRIGARTFEHGLGTHANSEIAVTVPPGARRFEAFVGIDNNDDTGGTRGSVQFSVELEGREVFRTETLTGGMAPVPVSIDLPADTRELVLKVDTTPDGPAHDQADWADARLVMADGRTLWLDEGQRRFFLLQTDPPFSFLYAGTPSAELLSGWEHAVETHEADDWVEYRATWTDPRTRLRVIATAKAFRRYPAVEWVLSFENGGEADTPILEQIQALDVLLRTGNSKRAAVLHHLSGDACGESTFLPQVTSLEAGQRVAMAPTGGRPSSISAFPFFNLQYADGGVITGIGWSGQWAASLERSATGPTRLCAGMERTHLRLRPGERIRTPRVLLMPWRGERQTAHNRFRRLILFHYVPQQNGRPLRLPVVSQCFDRYSWTRADWATEAGQIRAAEFAHAIGCDHHWLDAAWFVGGFPNGAGNWFHKPAEFPRGLKPVSDACHRLGLKFVLWFEPERVHPGSQIAREHPEFVFGGEEGGLFKLSDPDARRWLTELLSQRIREYGVDVYRNDFNIDPLPFWRANDAEDRQGITEIRYVEGHYALWDELLARHPGLVIDNCASGGRRIDLETITRSVPLWRSDTSCSPGHPDWNQAQSYGLGLYLPLHTACGWTPEPYDFRSAATAGAICQWAYLDEDFPLPLAKATIAEAKANQPYWYGDFYPLTPCTTTPDQFMAYQLHRADLNAGLVLAFRRPECDLFGLIVSLRGLDPEATYVLEIVDDARRKRMRRVSGKALQTEGLELRLSRPGSSLIVRYRAVNETAR